MADRMHNEIAGGQFYSAVVQGRDITVQLPPRVTPAMSALPKGSKAFTGHDAELRTLLARLAPPSDAHATAVTAVVGMAGVGKTELAVQAARAALDQDWFPGGVLYADLLGYDTVRRLDPGRVLGGWLGALGIPGERVPPDAGDRARLFASVLTDRARQGRRVLVVIDNASSHGQAGPLLPTDGDNAAIITSRHMLSMFDAHRLDLNVLAAPDAVLLLQRAVEMLRSGDTRVRDQPADAAGIARLCGGLPLALRIIAALLTDTPARPLAGMVADLTDTDSRLEEMSYADADTEIAVRAAFDLSYRHLTPEQARLFRLMALSPGGEWGVDAAATLADRTGSRVRRLLNRLRGAHLIEDGTADERYRFHDLMREYAGERLAEQESGPDRAAAADRLMDYYLETVGSAATWLGGKGSLFRSREQAVAWLDAEYSNLLAAVVAEHDRGRWQTSYLLASRLSGYFEFRHLADDGITTQTLALDAATRLGRVPQANAASNLGNAYRIAHHYEAAVVHLSHAHELARQAGQTAMEGLFLHNLGLAYFNVGEYEKAESCHRADLSICVRRGDQRGQAHAWSSLGDALRMQKRFSEAVETLDKAIALLQLLGSPHEIMFARINLALASLDWRPATTPSYIVWQLCSALQTAKETDNRPAKATIFLNLSVAYVNRGHHESAVHWAKEAAALFASLHDPRREAGALRQVGVAYLGTGEVSQARPYFERALAMFEDLGPSGEIEATRTYLNIEDGEITVAPAAGPPDEAARLVTEWCDDLPHAVLRGETARLEEIVFAVH
ncbi:ATP-binding protein [Acrocarpospora corrugata]|uniref:ATP-binding protein n=1 Tax=Acrocarpospora corrugata TaxID=35763 RepID=UPI0012D31538|nr:tetratricopeptide repeat protein [Acrocarpospora corrugata]